MAVGGHSWLVENWTFPQILFILPKIFKSFITFCSHFKLYETTDVSDHAPPISAFACRAVQLSLKRKVANVQVSWTRLHCYSPPDTCSTLGCSGPASSLWSPSSWTARTTRAWPVSGPRPHSQRSWSVERSLLFRTDLKQFMTVVFLLIGREWPWPLPSGAQTCLWSSLSLTPTRDGPSALRGSCSTTTCWPLLGRWSAHQGPSCPTSCVWYVPFS